MKYRILVSSKGTVKWLRVRLPYEIFSALTSMAISDTLQGSSTLKFSTCFDQDKVEKNLILTWKDLYQGLKGFKKKYIS